MFPNRVVKPVFFNYIGNSTKLVWIFYIKGCPFDGGEKLQYAKYEYGYAKKYGDQEKQSPHDVSPKFQIMASVNPSEGRPLSLDREPSLASFHTPSIKQRLKVYFGQLYSYSLFRNLKWPTSDGFVGLKM